MAQQLTAERELKDSSSPLRRKGSGHSSGKMTNSEVRYLTSMEKVAMLSSKLEGTEAAIDLAEEWASNDTDSSSSSTNSDIITSRELDHNKQRKTSFDAANEGDDESDSGGANDSDNGMERERLARRARRAEIRADVAAKEAMAAKEEAEQSRLEAEWAKADKERELVKLQVSKLNHAYFLPVIHNKRNLI